jgi:hypothetical protein
MLSTKKIEKMKKVSKVQNLLFALYNYFLQEKIYT